MQFTYQLLIATRFLLRRSRFPLRCGYGFGRLIAQPGQCIADRADRTEAVAVGDGAVGVPGRKDDLNDPDETHSFQYDLDGDGKKDTIRGTLWQRWGRIMWTVEFANGKTFSSEDACKRIGVLPSKINGVNDLVCDQGTVLHWNGAEYK